MTTETKLPTPLYAAAGAADLAREKIEHLTTGKGARKLRNQAVNFGGRAVGAAAGLVGRAAELREALSGVDLASDADKARKAARRGAATFVTKAQATYDKLVERGTIVLEGEPEAPANTEPVQAEASIADTAADAPVADAAPKKRVAKKAVRKPAAE